MAQWMLCSRESTAWPSASSTWLSTALSGSWISSSAISRSTRSRDAAVQMFGMWRRKPVVVARAHRAELLREKESASTPPSMWPSSERLDALAGPREQQVALLVRRLPEDLGLALGEQPELDHLARLLRRCGDALVEERVNGVEVPVEVVDGGLRLGVGVDQARADAEADVVQRRLHGVRGCRANRASAPSTYDRSPSSRKSGKKLYDAIRLPTCDRASTKSRPHHADESRGAPTQRMPTVLSAVERSASPTAVQSTLCIFPDDSRT